MAKRLVPWLPERGTGIESAVDAEPAPGLVDTRVECPEWRAVAPASGPPPAVQIVDGVRRAEAQVMEDDPELGLLYGVFGTFAVGVVRAEPRAARIVEEHTSVERRYLQCGGSPTPVSVPAGARTISYEPRVPLGAVTPNDLLKALNDYMLDAESHLAADLAHDVKDETLTFIDGPLRHRQRGRPVIGYVKRVHTWYLDTAELRLLPQLRLGERTPLFRIAAGPAHDADRYSWFVRLAQFGPAFHPLATCMRCEVSGDLPLNEARALADASVRALPWLASTPQRDPRAPQNLVPVGALEAHLTRQLGDRRWMYRLIGAALAGEAAHAAVEEGA